MILQIAGGLFILLIVGVLIGPAMIDLIREK